MKKQNLVIGLATLVVTFFAWTQAREIPFQGLRGGLGPAFFPSLLMASMALIGVVFVFLAWFTPAGVQAPPEKKHYGLLALIVGLSAVYGFFFEKLGFSRSTWLFLALTMLAFRVKWWKSMILSSGITGVLYVVFIHLFKAPLP